ncbi:MAG: lipocalin family protein [Gammaproteobacteria bacterium]|jgi:apolipoprotein D and lipocalin family protein
MRHFTVLLLPVLLTACPSDTPRPPAPTTVDRVDLERYQGLWYETAKIPNRFQDHCVANTTADYRLGEDRRMRVLNRCLTEDGDWDEARGVARVVDPTSNARLEVSFVSLFGWQLFWGDYWILDLAPDYSYAVVGTPARDYGWILSRTPQLSASTRAAIDRRLREQGYDPDDFEATLQGMPQPPAETP